MKQENLLQIVESYLNIMCSISEKDISYKLLENVYEIVRNKVKSLEKSEG